MADRYIKYIITTDSTGAITGMKRVEQGATTLGGKLEETGGKLKSLGSGMTSFGHKLTALSLPLIAVGGYSIKMAMDIQTSMTQLQTQAGAGAKEVKFLEGAVLKLGPKVAEGPKELAEALYPIRSVGLQGAEAMKALTASAKGAQISGAGLTETANAMAGALRTQMYDVKSASGAMSIMNGIVGYGKMHMSELADAMGTDILPQAKDLGLGFRDIGAALDAMTRQNVPATMEATRLRLTLTQMTAPSGAALRALKSIGLGQFTLANDLRKPEGLVVALRALHEHLQKLSKDQQTLDLSEAFGKSKGSANVLGLLNALPEMEGIRTKLASSGESQLNQAFGTRSQNAAFKMQQALAAGKAALIQFGQTLIPIVIPALAKFSKLVIDGIEWLKKMPKPLKDVVIGFTLLLAVGGPLLIFFGTMNSAVGSILTGLGKVTPVLGSFGKTAAAVEAEAGEAGLAGSLGGLGGGFAALATKIALPVAALTSLLYLMDKIKLPKSLGGDGHSLMQEASSLNPFGGKGAIGEAGLSPAREAGALAAWRNRQPVGVLAPAIASQIAEKQASEASYAARALPANALREELHIYIDGEPVAFSVTKRIRNSAVHAKPVAEGVAKYAQNRAARE